MAARRGNKRQATRNSSSQATPAWVWVVLALLVGVGIYFIVPGLSKQDGDGFFRPQPNPDAQPEPVASADVESVVPESLGNAPGNTETAGAKPGDADAAPKETQYEFYRLLPGKEVEMSDAELAASAREEEARKAREAQRAAAALNGQSPIPATATASTPSTTPANPKPLDETPAATQRPTTPAATSSTPAAAAAQPAPTRTAETVASADTSARYILQAGAFAASGDAEATKAKIALLGLSARVESAQINGKTVYRVRMGPYGSASELSEAKGKLASGGLPAMAIKAQ